ncbi:MAG: NnrU family protein [Dongiaceae bacterium]
MTGSIVELVIAAAAFVGSHFYLSSGPPRAMLVERFGERGFLGIYSLLALLLLVGLIVAYAGAPFVEIWSPPGFLAVLPLLVMPVAIYFVIAGNSQPNPTAVGASPNLDRERPAPGVFAITRQPVMWGIGSWALSHLAINGDLASILLFGSIAGLALYGTRVIDAKKRRAWPAEQWQRFAAATSNLPFAAIIAGRVDLKVEDLGWWRLGLAVVLYFVLLATHSLFAGVPVLSI